MVPQSSKREFKCMIQNDPVKDFDDLSSHCFQGEFYPFFYHSHMFLGHFFLAHHRTSSKLISAIFTF